MKIVICIQIFGNISKCKVDKVRTDNAFRCGIKTGLRGTPPLNLYHSMKGLLYAFFMPFRCLEEAVISLLGVDGGHHHLEEDTVSNWWRALSLGY